MFKKISKIKEIKHLNARLKESRLNVLHQQAIAAHELSKEKSIEFTDYRLIKEEEIMSDVLGEVVSLFDIDLMNEKVNGLRNTEIDLKMDIREKMKAKDAAFACWQEGVRSMIVAQKAVDKFDYINEIEAHKDNIKKQNIEDLELEEFKSIKTLEY